MGWVAPLTRVVAVTQRWDGSHWTTLTPPRPAGAVQVHLLGVSCPTATDCTAVGSYADKDQKQHPLAARWNGQHWVVQKPPVAGSAAGGLSAVSCVSASNCTAVGHSPSGGAALADDWNGSNWTVQPTAPPAGNKSLFSVSCVSAGTCTAVGAHANANGNALAEHK